MQPSHHFSQQSRQLGLQNQKTNATEQEEKQVVPLMGTFITQEQQLLNSTNQQGLVATQPDVQAYESCASSNEALYGAAGAVQQGQPTLLAVENFLSPTPATTTPQPQQTQIQIQPQQQYQQVIPIPVGQNQFSQMHMPIHPDLLKSFVTDQKLQQQTQQQQMFENQQRQNILGGPADPMLQTPLFVDPALFSGKLPLNVATLHMPGLQASPAPGLQPLDSSSSPIFPQTRGARGGVIEPFPERLHRLLLEVEAAGRSNVISFIANGRAFAIHKPDDFFKEIVPNYFRQSRLSSFKRQLNLYGFELINSGPARGGYYHEMFVKDRPELCRRMRRVAVKVPHKARTQPQNSSDEILSEEGLGLSQAKPTDFGGGNKEPTNQHSFFPPSA